MLVDGLMCVIVGCVVPSLPRRVSGVGEGAGGPGRCTRKTVASPIVPQRTVIRLSPHHHTSLPLRISGSATAHHVPVRSVKPSIITVCCINALNI